MDTNFDKCLAFVLKEEGGNDDDPNDHGGRTSRGITQREWDKYLITHPGLPTDVWKAPDADIRTIYHDSYWMPHSNILPTGLDLCFFDFAVNAGTGQAIKTLQRTLGIPADGVWGPQTEGAINYSLNAVDTINKYCDFRESFYKGLAQFSRYGKGWLGRNERCRKESIDLLSTVSGNPSIKLPSPQANPADIKTKVAPAVSTVIVGTTAATVAAHQGHSPLIFLSLIGGAVIIALIIHYFVNRKVN